jgi:hypothetical protein
MPLAKLYACDLTVPSLIQRTSTLNALLQELGVKEASGIAKRLNQLQNSDDPWCAIEVILAVKQKQDSIYRASSKVSNSLWWNGPSS